MARRLFPFIACVVAPWVGLALLYAWLAGAGEPFKPWPGYLDYDELQAQGFLQGHLHLSVEPSAELLAQADPRDPSLRAQWVWDASLYRGHYYLYWGPVPALLMAAVKWVFRIAWLGDAFAVYVFALLALAAVGALLWRLRAQHFPRTSPVLVAVALLAVGLTGPVLHLLTTAAVYQAAIIGAQAFLLLGLAASAARAGAIDDARAGRWRLWAAGLAYGLALATRVSVAPAVALLVALTAWSSMRGVLREGLKDLLALAAPVASVCALLLFYNWLRFDDPLQFGIGLQMTTFKFQPSFAYLPANLHAYCLRGFTVDPCTFPYLLQAWYPGAESLPSWIHPPADYLIGEPLVGWLKSMPITWLGPAALLLRRAPADAPTHRARSLGWYLGSFAILATVNAGVPLLMFSATMRYLGDVAFGLCLLGAAGAFALSQVRRRALAWSAIGVVCALQMLVGFALGFQGYNDHFKRNRPELYARINKPLPWCVKAPSSAP